jgi:hypothetical protein
MDKEMKITSINQTLPTDNNFTAIRVEGAYLILTDGDSEVYFNDGGREVFRATSVSITPEPPILSLWARFLAWFTTYSLSAIEE